MLALSYSIQLTSTYLAILWLISYSFPTLRLGFLHYLFKVLQFECCKKPSFPLFPVHVLPIFSSSFFSILYISQRVGLLNLQQCIFIRFQATWSISVTNIILRTLFSNIFILYFSHFMSKVTKAYKRKEKVSFLHLDPQKMMWE